MRPLLLCRQSLISLRSPTRQKPSTSVSGPVLCVVHAIYEECIFILLVKTNPISTLLPIPTP